MPRLAHAPRRALVVGMFAAACTSANARTVRDSQDAGVASAQPAPSAKPAAVPAAKPVRKKPLCDTRWDGDFITIQIAETKYDGHVPRSYRPEAPEDPWEVVGGRHLFTRDEPDLVYTLLGKFETRPTADKFLARVETETHFVSMTSRSYPPLRRSLGAYLVSDQYTCTLERNNPAIEYADWIIELGGVLVTGDRSTCKRGKKQKTVTIVDCSGRKNLVKDVWTAPCDGSDVETCLFEMSPGVIGIQQDYSASEEGRQLSFRIYDTAKKKRLFAMKEGYDSTSSDEFTDVVDVDGDGIPELAGRVCVEGDCRRSWVRKWNGRTFQPADAK